MRSTNEIMVAVEKCGPCTEKELRLCVMSLKARLYVAEKAAGDMAAATEKGLAATKMRAYFWTNYAERRFASKKMPVDEYLGPRNTPGTAEYDKRLRLSKVVFKKATGVDLDIATG